MRVKLGAEVHASLPGPADGIGAAIEDPITGDVVVPWSPASTEVREGRWQEPTIVRAAVTLPGPGEAGDYLLAWGNASSHVAYVPLFVLA